MDRTVYRIIDANFNRAREAFRVIEDFCRFAANDVRLSTRARDLRHQLSAAVGLLDCNALLRARDTVRDVGINPPPAELDTRSDARDCFTAACKRLTEALRVLGELSQTVERTAAGKIQRLRYAAYILEKDALESLDPIEKFRPVRLYVIISVDDPGMVKPLAEHIAAGGADCIQLRIKSLDDRSLLGLCEDFVMICRDRGVLSIINDRADMAVLSGADGVHLGAADISAGQARRLGQSSLIVGYTTHSIEQIEMVLHEPVTYVSLGPVFATSTKPLLKPSGIEYLRAGLGRLSDTGIAHVAVGGITQANLGMVLEAGAGAVAVCSAVTQAADPGAATGALKEKIARAH